MTTIILSPALSRRFRHARSSLPELMVRCWFVFALGLCATVVFLVIASTLALALLGVAWLVRALPSAALLALCAIVVVGAVARANRWIEL